MSFDGRFLERSSRYLLSTPIAEGGMASVHLGRLVAEEGFARTVAVKRLHATYARDPHFVRMFLDEARIAARIQHPNIVDTLDVVARDGELFVVMDYIHGESLAALLATCSQRGKQLTPSLAAGIVGGVLRGLHAAHEATNERGEKLELIHRDVSPQNVFVGTDGFARVIDFGVAKALGRMQSTRDGEVKGKLSYMAPEQMMAQPIDRRADIFAAGIVLWEALTGKRLFYADDSVATMGKVMSGTVEPPSAHSPDVHPGLDAVVLRALARDRDQRFQTALDMAAALDATIAPAAPHEIGELVQSLAADVLAKRAELIRSLEDSTIPEIPNAPAQPRPSRPEIPVTTIAPPARRVPTWALASGAALLVAVAFGAGRVASPPPAAPPPPAPVVVEKPVQPPVGATIVGPTNPPPETTVAATLPPPPPPPVVTPPVQQGPRPPRGKDCSNPFRVDARGIKRPRPECFD